MASILANQTTENPSTEIVLAAGATATVFLRAAAGVTGFRRASVQIKAADNSWTTIGYLTSNSPATILSGAATYRIYKYASDTAFGVEQV